MKPIALTGVAMNKPNQSITGFTEVALRVHDLDLMRGFYEHVIGLEVLGENDPSDGSKPYSLPSGQGITIWRFSQRN